VAVARMCPASYQTGEAPTGLNAVDGSTRHPEVTEDLQRLALPHVAALKRLQQALQSIAKAPETQVIVAALRQVAQQVRRPVVAQRIRPTEAKRLPRRVVGRRRFVRTVHRARSCRARPARATTRRSPPASDPSAPGCVGLALALVGYHEHEAQGLEATP
jgi:hypothetical protein